ncbi:MAG: hypothetical protein LBN98_03010 [Prevotellaceae bacterium]|nr:hypothetical protein [Prevotellaceae bacterium]
MDEGLPPATSSTFNNLHPPSPIFITTSSHHHITTSPHHHPIDVRLVKAIISSI